MDREQFLEINGDEIKLTNVLHLDPLLQDNYLRRMENPSGMSENKLLRTVCSIPQEVLQRDPDGLIFLMAGNGTPEAKISLRRFLERNPRYNTSGGKI